MTEIAIKVDDVSKRFRVYKERPDSLKERVTSLHRIRHEDFWALQNVSLEVPKGCVYGLVGHNGSGKSSLLRIMAGIHRPTSGTVTTDGRISALLELGAGFHPDLSGRENVYLNSAILGLSKKETDRLYDQIVEFSGISEFMDTPVKHYSSGMYVRLGFSVAVHVEPQILIIDEVIAVGDEEFQRRCFEHLNKLRRQGATIVMVTHGLGFVSSLCDEATWLDHGHVLGQGPAGKVVRKYMSLVNEQEVERLEHEAAEAADVSDEIVAERRHGAIASIEGMDYLDGDDEHVAVATVLKPFTFRIRFNTSKPIRTPLISFALFTEGGLAISHPGMRFKNDTSPVIEGDGYVDFHVPRFPLAPGLYTINVAMHDRPGGSVLDRKDDAYQLHVQPGEKGMWGMVDLNGEWSKVHATEVDEARLDD